MQRSTFPFRAMACNNIIVIDALDDLHTNDAAQIMHAAADAAISEVKRIEAKYSRYLADSVTSIINNQAGRGVPSKIDEETLLLLDFAQSAYTESESLFDITSGVLRRIWNFSLNQLPSKTEIAAVLPLIGWQHVIRTNDSIYLPIAGMQIDFGGFGKEYACDRAAAILMAHGVTNGYVDLGGDIMVLGPQTTLAESAAWSLGVRHPRARVADQLLVTLDITQGAIATSGDYERYIEINGQRYSHILSPKTGMPVAGFQSVTVLAPSCMVAGSVSTIAMLKGETAGAQWLQASPFKALSVGAKGDLRHYQ